MTRNRSPQPVDIEAPQFKLPPRAERLRADLTPGIVHLWRIHLASTDTSINRAQDYLTDKEKDRATRYRVASERNRYIATHAALHMLLSTYLDCSTASIHIKTGSHGKPYIATPDTNLQFNLSHSGNWALIAYGRECEIGVDVERRRSIRQAQQLAVRYLDIEAQTSLSKMESPLLDWAFQMHWTRLEASLKAIGTGIAARGTHSSPSHRDIAANYSFSPAPDYVASLASTAAWKRLEPFDGSGLIATGFRLP